MLAWAELASYPQNCHVEVRLFWHGGPDRLRTCKFVGLGSSSWPGAWLGFIGLIGFVIENRRATRCARSTGEALVGSGAACLASYLQIGRAPVCPVGRVARWAR